MESTPAKRCRNCHETKKLSEFYEHKAMADGHLHQCKACILNKRHERYWADPEQARERQRQRALDPKQQQKRQNAARRRYYRDYRGTLMKNATIRSDPAHKEQTNRYNRARYERRVAWFIDQKRGRSCVHCGESDPVCLDWHHRDPSAKLFNIGEGLAPGRWTLSEVEAEITKCDPICANCHRKMHWQERHGRRDA